MSALTLLVALLAPALPAHASQITSRKLTLSSSSAAASNATTTYTFNFTLPSSTAVKSFSAQICTNTICSGGTPGGFSNSSAALGTITGLPGTWTINNSTAGTLKASSTNISTAPTNPITFTFTNVQNPTTANQTFYAVLTTFSDTAWTPGNAIDSGVVAASTANQMTVSASVPETLTFCTGTSGITSTSCSGATGTSVGLGTLTTTSTGAATSQMGATTNAGIGYIITVNGTTLTSGANTIAAMSSSVPSTQASSQFGINLVSNTTPSIGTNPSGAGSATPFTGYGTTNNFKFNNGDTVATSSGAADDFRLFTISYIANISNITPPGTYTTTLTYICTATY